jgi:hypothetical protein
MECPTSQNALLGLTTAGMTLVRKITAITLTVWKKVRFDAQYLESETA